MHEVFHAAWFESNAERGFMAVRVARRVLDLHLVETWRKRLDVRQALQDGPMFKACHTGRDKNSQMADMRVGQIDDALPCSLQVCSVGVDRRDPAKCLLRRRDVVAIGGENDERVSDSPQIGRVLIADLEQALLDLVADKQILDDGEDLLAAQEVEAPPPTLELKKALLLAVDVVEEVGVFLPNRLFRLEALEILRQPGTVEASIAEVGGQMRKPGATKQAAGQAHWVHAGFASPVRQGRAIQHHWPGQPLAVCSQQCHCPAGLAVAIEHRRLSRVALRHVFDETSQRMQHIRQRLTRCRFGKENNEVDRMAFVHSHADFGVVFEAADAGAVAGARIDHDHGRLVEVDAVVPAVFTDLRDAQQCIVGRAFKFACVEQRFIFEVEQRRHARALVFEHVVGALAQRVPEQD